MVTKAIENALKHLGARVLWRRSEGRLEQDGWVKTEDAVQESNDPVLLPQEVIWVKEVSRRRAHFHKKRDTKTATNEYSLG